MMMRMKLKWKAEADEKEAIIAREGEEEMG